MPKLTGVFSDFAQLGELTAEDLNHWLQPKEDPGYLKNYLGNKILYPQTIPVTRREMGIDLAILREYLRRDPEIVYHPKLKKIILHEALILHFPPLAKLIGAILDAIPLEGTTSVLLIYSNRTTETLGKIISAAQTGEQTFVAVDSLNLRPESQNLMIANIRPRILTNQVVHVSRFLDGSDISIVKGMEVGPEEKIGTSTKAGVFGVVEQINRPAGEVVIKTLATVIYGLIGAGGQRGGILKIPANFNSSDLSGQIAVKTLISAEDLKKARDKGAPGVISGGVNAADFRPQTGSTILMTEGFGPLPMGQDILQLLKSHEGKLVFVDGNLQRIILPDFKAEITGRLRKISLPPAKSAQNLPDIRLGEIEIGRRARVVFAPFLGIQGKIRAIDNTPTLLESGISTYLVTIETEHKKIKLPFRNIELIA